MENKVLTLDDFVGWETRDTVFRFLWNRLRVTGLQIRGVNGARPLHLLITGPGKSGKKTLAKLVAKSCLCIRNNGHACGTCHNCRHFERNCGSDMKSYCTDVKIDPVLLMRDPADFQTEYQQDGDSEEEVERKHDIYPTMYPIGHAEPPRMQPPYMKELLTRITMNTSRRYLVLNYPHQNLNKLRKIAWACLIAPRRWTSADPAVALLHNLDAATPERQMLLLPALRRSLTSVVAYVDIERITRINPVLLEQFYTVRITPPEFCEALAFTKMLVKKEALPYDSMSTLSALVEASESNIHTILKLVGAAQEAGASITRTFLHTALTDIRANYMPPGKPWKQK